MSLPLRSAAAQRQRVRTSWARAAYREPRGSWGRFPAPGAPSPQEGRGGSLPPSPGHPESSSPSPAAFLLLPHKCHLGCSQTRAGKAPVLGASLALAEKSLARSPELARRVRGSRWRRGACKGNRESTLCSGPLAGSSQAKSAADGELPSARLRLAEPSLEMWLALATGAWRSSWRGSPLGEPRAGKEVPSCRSLELVEEPPPPAWEPGELTENPPSPAGEPRAGRASVGGFPRSHSSQVTVGCGVRLKAAGGGAAPPQPALQSGSGEGAR